MVKRRCLFGEINASFRGGATKTKRDVTTPYAPTRESTAVLVRSRMQALGISTVV